MAISDTEIRAAVEGYLARNPEEVDSLKEAVSQLSLGTGLASRITFPMHTTVGALLVRDGEVLLVRHRAYGILLQPGGHLEPGDDTLLGAALRELVEETGIDTAKVTVALHRPVYVEYGPVPANSVKNEPAHFHLDVGFAFTAPAHLEVGKLQEEEVTGAGWYPLAIAERLVGNRISRAICGPAGIN
ncbi:NUDIX hydrolase [Microlunatus speluncae]|uniref:NUDIX hydrolase n=1 Tax=Microlunatus speluncae TaxID=2594267 RepID=UPI0012663CC6|nr:NUDIX domain-containing protein [Microlunatus speluncae]